MCKTKLVLLYYEMVDNENKGSIVKDGFSLEEMWKESNGEISSKTFLEMVRLGKRINSYEDKNRTAKIVLSALAILSSLALAAIVTFSITRSKYNVSPLDGTGNLVAEYGKTSSVTLEDGTVVHLNSGSSLLYPESFNGKGKRMVFLSGEGSFSVAKDPSKPFIVRTAYMDVQALGTVFNVCSFIGEKTVNTTLKEGKVKVDIPSSGKESVILEPGMQLVYTPLSKEISIIKVDVAKTMGWEEGYLSFTNATFQEITSVLERRFNVSISYNSTYMQNNALNVRFRPDETIEDAMDVLTLLIPGSSYRKTDDRIFFSF